MKKILIVFSLCGLILTGCENFLDTENLLGKNTGNFPTTEAEVSDMLTSVYRSVMGMEKQPAINCRWAVSEFLSDDRFAGGGINDTQWAAVEAFNIIDANFFSQAWSRPYEAIYRANSVLAALDGVTWSSEAARGNIEGQARFLRAYAYFNLAQMFGTAPITLTPDPVNNPRASAEELYGVIAMDLKKAIELMPTQARFGGNVNDRARATKWAAEAYMARVFLFYTGYYGKTDMPVAAEGEEAAGTITKDQVVGWLNECISPSSGHDLIDNYAELWPYSNESSNGKGKTDDPTKVYPYAVDNDLVWIGEKGDNVETVFALVSVPTAADWADNSYAHPLALYFSPRQHAEAGDKIGAWGYYPFGYGWGHGPVNSRIVEAWPAGDPRKDASILDVNKELPQYLWGGDSQVDETGLWQKKYMRIMAPKGGNPVNYGIVEFGDFVNTNMQLGEVQDLVVMRFSDVLLMHSELTGTADGINRVRARVGLAPVAYSLDALKAERRFELAFEGNRYYDLLRWHDEGLIITNQTGVAVKRMEIDEVKNMPANLAQRLSETGGFMPIPRGEIDLSNGVLEQTPGWTL
jgi:hypothetical protein